MASLQKVVVILLVMTLILSAVSIVLNVIIFKMNSSYLTSKNPSSNSGNLGFFVESTQTSFGDNNGG